MESHVSLETQLVAGEWGQFDFLGLLDYSSTSVSSVTLIAELQMEAERTIHPPYVLNTIRCVP